MSGAGDAPGVDGTDGDAIDRGGKYAGKQERYYYYVTE